MSELLVTKGSADIVPAEEVSISPMNLLHMSISQGASIDQLTKLMDLQDRWQANESRKAFVAAMAEFKKSSIRIIKDKTNGQYSSKYVSLGNLVNTVTPFLSEQGLSIRWDIDQSTAASIRVSCIVTHAMGHSESVAMVCPPDKSGAKNPIQEIKSAITYAKAATFESICGLASTDANLDDDGNGTKSKEMDLAEFDRIKVMIENAETVDSLKEIYMSALKTANGIGDQAAIRAFGTAKDKRYKELHNANR